MFTDTLSNLSRVFANSRAVHMQNDVSWVLLNVKLGKGRVPPRVHIFGWPPWCSSRDVALCSHIILFGVRSLRCRCGGTCQGRSNGSSSPGFQHHLHTFQPRQALPLQIPLYHCTWTSHGKPETFCSHSDFPSLVPSLSQVIVALLHCVGPNSILRMQTPLHIIHTCG
jgi:hypothetical protein